VKIGITHGLADVMAGRPVRDGSVNRQARATSS
jgi:hypothetical protein